MDVQRRILMTGIMILMILVSATASGAWENDFDLNQKVSDTGTTQVLAQVLSDGDGGSYHLWIDFNFSSLYGQHLDASGAEVWTENGINLSSATSVDSYDAVLGDNGELWIALSAYIAGNYDVIVQRITPDGTRAFGALGYQATPLSPLGTNQFAPRIISDGTGSAILSWSDTRDSASSGKDIWAQRIHTSGTLLWASAGVPVCQAMSDQIDVFLVKAAPGSAMFFWSDYRSYTSTDVDIYGERLDGNGNSVWTLNGKSICSLTGDQLLNDVASDGMGGALLAWRDSRDLATTSNDIYLHRIHSLSGDFWWSSNGIPVCQQAESQYSPKIAPDGLGGAVVIWRDYRTDSYDGTSVYGQYIRANGDGAWADDGMIMFARDGTCSLSTRPLIMTADGDFMLTCGWNNVVLTQKVTDTGYRSYGSQGYVTCSYAAFANDPRLCSDGRGGAITSWEDIRAGYYSSIYAQRVERWGLGGSPEPALTAVQDRPGDQGGEVILSWAASPLDTYADPYVDSYTAWMRLADTPPLAAVSADVVLATADASGLKPEQVLPLLETGWVLVGNQDAYKLESYGLHVPTYGDSTEAGTPLTTYQVMAHDTYYGAVWASGELSGWSVDNLAPGAPLALAAMLEGVDVDLNWNASGDHDEDLAAYHVHRSAVSGFTPGPATFVGAVTDTVFTDHAPPAGPQYYMVTAVDVHGNQGDPSNQVQVESVTGVESGGLPAVFVLRGAAPNPFNPATAIRLDVPRTGRVRVEIYDARGSLVRTLHDGPLAAGQRTLAWLGRDDAGHAVSSGVYLVRAVDGGEVTSLKLTLAR